MNLLRAVMMRIALMMKTPYSPWTALNVRTSSVSGQTVLQILAGKIFGSIASKQPLHLLSRIVPVLTRCFDAEKLRKHCTFKSKILSLSNKLVSKDQSISNRRMPV